MSTAIPSLHRSRRMVQRNLIVYRHAWMIIFSGFFEPVFYLLAMGFGLGGLIGGVGGVPYSAFVAPGLLASSCMNGAITDGFFNIFFKLHHQKTYDGILATPMRVPDVAFGEMLWALMRGSLYVTAFVIVMLILGGLTGSPIILSRWAALVLPAAILVSASFSCLALCASSFVRTWQDFDIAIGGAVMPMFLFSGTFFPVQQLPAGLQWIVRLTPLYHGVETLRQLTIGNVNWSILVHIAYLILIGGITFVIAMRRLERALIK